MALVTMRVMTPRPAIGGRYRLGDKLGQGAAGVVWQAWDVRLGRTVAVKQLTIPPGLAGADARRAHADAAREGRIAARLQHPAVAAMLDMVVEDGSSWLVMEHAPGRSLLAALEEKPLPPLQVARIGAELADALAVAHAAGVVHCDVKPANVLLGDDGTVKLADFGIARAVRGERMTGPLVLSGTPLFMAPEVARGTWPDGASDVYSLAATLYAAVEGTGPFGAMDHDDPVAMIRRVAETAPRPPRRAGPLTAVLTSLLAVDPAARPTAAATRDLLREIASPSTSPVTVAPSAAPGTPRPAAPRPPRRARTLTALSTLGVVGVGAVAGTVGGGSVLAAVTSTAPAPFDHIAILGGAPDGASTVVAPSPGAAVGMPAGTGLDQEAPPVPAMGAPIVPESDGSSASSVSSSSGDGAEGATSRTVSSAAARPSTGSADQALPVDAGVIHDVPLAGPVLGDTVAGIGSTVDDLPVDLGIGDGPLGLPVHLGGGDGPLGLPVHLGGGDGPLGLPVNLPIDLGSGDGEGPLGLPVNLPVDLGGGEGGDGPLGLPVNLPVHLGSSGSDGAGGSDGLPVKLPVDLGGDGLLGLPLGGSTNASSGAGSDTDSGSGSSGSSGSSLLGLPGGLLGGGSNSSGSAQRANGSDDGSRSTASSDSDRSGSSSATGSLLADTGRPLSVLSFPGAKATSGSDSESRSSGSGSSGSRSSDSDSSSGSSGSRSSGESESRGATSTLGSVLRAAG